MLAKFFHLIIVISMSTLDFDLIRRLQPELARVRQDIHAHPELGFQEHRTAELVARYLRDWGYEVHTGVGGTGVVGILQGLQPGPARSIGLRADMDALPIQEKTDLPYQSKHERVMHACGHDGHTAILLGAAQYLACTRAFSGVVVLIFQPAEEGLGGAQAMLDDGLFSRFPCDEIYALHNWPGLAPGVIGVNPGPMMAAADEFDIVVHGQGGHGAHAYQTIDPIVIAAQVITALQSIVARNVPALDAAVITVAAIKAGTIQARNVIPDQAQLSGTVRTFKAEVQALVQARMNSVVQGIAQAYGAKIELNYRCLFPATVNHAPQAEKVARIAIDLFGESQVQCPFTPSMGAEDFSYMLQVCPGAYFRLGQGGAEQGRVLHNAMFDFNDDVIATGVAMFVALVQDGTQAK